MKRILFAVISISIGALPAQGVVIRSSMNWGALSHAETWLRYKQPIQSNVESDDWKRVVREFTSSTETRPSITKCLATVYMTDYLRGDISNNIDSTSKPIPNHNRICAHSSFHLGKDLTFLFKIPQRLLEVELMVVPTSQRYGGKAPQIVSALSPVKTVTDEQKNCLDQAHQAMRDGLSSDLTRWLVKLGTRVSLHLDDNTSKVDEMEAQRDIGFVFTARAGLEMKIYLNDQGKCLHPDKAQVAQILSAMERWSRNPSNNYSDPFMFRHRL